MANRLRQSLLLYPMDNWSDAVHKRKVSLSERMNDWPYWTKMATKWSPVECKSFNLVVPYRGVGHPCARWDDHLE